MSPLISYELGENDVYDYSFQLSRHWTLVFFESGLFNIIAKEWVKFN